MTNSGTNGDKITVALNHVSSTVVPSAIGSVLLFDADWDLDGMDGVTNGDVTSCLNAAAPYTACDTLDNALIGDPSVNYIAASTGPGINQYVTAGPYQVLNPTDPSGFSFIRNPNYTASMPGGLHGLTILYYDDYPNVADMEQAEGQGLVNVSDGYQLSDLSGLKAYGNGVTEFVGGESAPSDTADILTFNQTSNIKAISGDPTFPQNGCTHTCIQNPFRGAFGKNLRDALAMSFNRQQLIETGYGVGALDAQALVSYCAPILCPASGADPPSPTRRFPVSGIRLAVPAGAAHTWLVPAQRPRANGETLELWTPRPLSRAMATPPRHWWSTFRRRAGWRTGGSI